MKLGIARGGMFFAGSAIIGTVLAVLGIVRFSGDKVVDASDYLQLPHWALYAYIALPALIGLCVFFYIWQESIELANRRAAQEREKEQRRRDEED